MNFMSLTSPHINETVGVLLWKVSTIIYIRKFYENQKYFRIQVEILISDVVIMDSGSPLE